MRKPRMVTDRELEILKILWARGRANVREVQEDLNRSGGPAVAYSTVQTLLNIMEEKKGLVRHVVVGRTFIYAARKPPDRTIRELTQQFLDRVFDGSLDRLLAAALESRSLGAEEIAQLRRVLEEAETRRRLVETVDGHP